MVELRIADVDFGSLLARPFHPSPAAWEDRILSFLLLGRFSDGRERGYRDNRGDPIMIGTTTMLRPEDTGNAVRPTEDE